MTNASFESDANAQRIVACVNACEGMEDPGKAIPEMLEALKLAKRYLEHPDVQAIPFALNASVPLSRIVNVIAKAEGETTHGNQN